MNPERNIADTLSFSGRPPLTEMELVSLIKWWARLVAPVATQVVSMNVSPGTPATLRLRNPYSEPAQATLRLPPGGSLVRFEYTDGAATCSGFVTCNPITGFVTPPGCQEFYTFDVSDLVVDPFDVDVVVEWNAPAGLGVNYGQAADNACAGLPLSVLSMLPRGILLRLLVAAGRGMTPVEDRRSTP